MDATAMLAVLERVPGRTEVERRAAAARLMAAWHVANTGRPHETTLQSLASMCGYSPWHLQRVFKAVFGVAPKEVARRRRLQAAAELLRVGDDGINEVVARTGFRNRSAFSRLFKSVYGVSPKAYRLRREFLGFRSATGTSPLQPTVADPNATIVSEENHA
jgi:AraC-like DNA-binding protein